MAHIRLEHCHLFHRSDHHTPVLDLEHLDRYADHGMLHPDRLLYQCQSHVSASNSAADNDRLGTLRTCPSSPTTSLTTPRLDTMSQRFSRQLACLIKQSTTLTPRHTFLRAMHSSMRRSLPCTLPRSHILCCTIVNPSGQA